MAKKKKLTGYDREVTENEQLDLCWSTGKMQWRMAGTLGINLFVAIAGKEHPLVFARDLKEAGFFAEGVEAGFHAAERIRALSADREEETPVEKAARKGFEG